MADFSLIFFKVIFHNNSVQLKLVILQNELEIPHFVRNDRLIAF